jgi:ketopantoate reductase (EC 1.1.1.169)
MKSQDTQPALEALRMASVHDQAVFCMQNSVANERMALRVLPNVHAITVMLPATYLTPGEVISYSTPQFGMFDIGRYPSGLDSSDTALAEVLNAANFAAFADPSVMASKYGKLLMNLGNISGAAHGAEAPDGALRRALRLEGEVVLKAAGIAFADVGQTDPRRAIHVNLKPVPGQPAMSNSTLQSLQRGGGIETDYLNGEICLLGRLHGVPTPLNDGMMDLAVRMLREGLAPGSVPLATTMAELGLG